MEMSFLTSVVFLGIIIIIIIIITFDNFHFTTTNVAPHMLAIQRVP